MNRILQEHKFFCTVFLAMYLWQTKSKVMLARKKVVGVQSSSVWHLKEQLQMTMGHQLRRKKFLLNKYNTFCHFHNFIQETMGQVAQSLWWLPTGSVVQGWIPVGEIFSAPVQTGPEAHPASCTMGTGSFPGVRCGQGVMLTPHPLLVPRSKIEHGAIPLLSPRAFVAYYRVKPTYSGYHSFIQYSVWRQVQSLLQNDSSI